MSASPPASNDALLEQRLATKVFGIPELAETILLNLPMKDLLFAQLICKDIKNLIDSSKPIQRALFFLPGEAKSAHFESKHMSAPFNCLHEGEDHGFPSEGGVNVNPLLCRYRFAKPRSYEPGWHEFKVHQRALDAICSAAWRAERDGSFQVVPSCAKMYLTQPPIALSVDSAVAYDEVELVPHLVSLRSRPLGSLVDPLLLHGKPLPGIQMAMAGIPTIDGDSRVIQLCSEFNHIWLWFRESCEKS
ncbi:hypothetical protein KC343_g4370 [Hortaea werneckii]|nr:hypothetical protein KC352_g11587 [Hortaea werneckii]KAI7570528.1 hypothetical protein KC317_g2386 [Hortaea werneckii]KAI7611956.1 hypothetical protein KC346_g8053 [Hortaea werneckii]KAI7630858.1 hypothetical protein KC343_g4370 [Hortaea werneckii]KAI7679387.1 hypothetical protein KC319_g2795 [Hortaea werneckii]